MNAWFNNWRVHWPRKNEWSCSGNGKWSYKSLEITRFSKDGILRLRFTYFIKRNRPPIAFPDPNQYLDGTEEKGQTVIKIWKIGPLTIRWTPLKKKSVSN